MRIGKTLGLGLFMSLAVMAFGAGSALAVEGELLLKPGLAYPQPFTSSSTHTSKLVAEDGSTIECTSLLNKGTLNGPKDLLVLVLFHKCETGGGLATCQSAGEPDGLIHALWLGLVGNLTGKVAGILFEPDKASHFLEFECAGIPVIVNGAVNGNITFPGVKVLSRILHVNIEVKVPGVEQKFPELEDKKISVLTISIDGDAFERATLEVIEDVIEFNAGVEVEYEP